MALSANPLENRTSANGKVSSQKSFQNFNGNITASTTENYSNPGNYVPNTAGANATFISNLLTGLQIRNPGFTAVVTANGNQEVWGTADAVPATGLPPGNTRFTKLYFSGNENISSGNMASP